MVTVFSHETPCSLLTMWSTYVSEESAASATSTDDMCHTVLRNFAITSTSTTGPYPKRPIINFSMVASTFTTLSRCMYFSHLLNRKYLNYWKTCSKTTRKGASLDICHSILFISCWVWYAVFTHFRCKGLIFHLIIINDTYTHTLGLLWTRDRFVSNTYTRQQTTFTTDRTHVPVGIRTDNSRKRASTNLRLRPPDHRDRLTRFSENINFSNSE